MKVAWIITGFAQDEGDYNGAPAIHKLAETLSNDSGIDLDIYALYYPVNIPVYNYYNSRVFSFASGNKITRADKYFIWKKAERKFKLEHSIRKYDIIHSIWSGEPGNLASKLVGKMKIPFITSVCGGELAEFNDINYGSRLKYWQKKFVSKSFSGADRIVAGSDYIIKLIRKHYNKEISDKCVRISFGADNKMFYPKESIANHKRSFPVLLNIASAVPVKNHKMLFEAFGIVRKKFPEAMLIICGKDERGILKEMAETMHLSDSTEIKGFVPYESLPEIINSSDIYVLSSLYESQNLSILEAAFCGIPVVSTDVGMASEITLLISGTDNCYDLAEKIIQTAENIRAEKEQSKEKVNLLVETYSVKSAADKTIDLYKTIMMEYDKR